MKTIAGRYRIQNELGSGSMGTVYQGLDTESNELVAIKQLRPELINTGLLERFKREGAALRELNHPNIVKMLAAVEENGQHYLIMEYVSGGDLSQYTQRHKKLEPMRSVNIALDLADALTRAHRLNIIHRDLKPANVLLADDDTPRLTDFGIAHMGGKSRVTDAHDIVGTLVYMPPEALNASAYDVQGDIWALGVMLFEMLTGDLPFDGKTFTEIIAAITTQPTPDLEILCQDAPIALIDLIYRMLEKDPAVRIRSIRQVGLELEDILAGRRIDKARFARATSTVTQRLVRKLPAQITAFVGRETELFELEKMVLNADLRLITTLAPGGMGKSRLALELASRLIESDFDVFANGICFIELAPLSSADDIPSAIATATGYQFRDRAGTPAEQILNYLANKNMLLILDNFEHVLAGAGFVRDMLQTAPGMTVLATSRERLNLTGEQLFFIGGMDFPDWETSEDALNYAAAKLFVQNAKHIRPDFDLQADDLTDLAQICRMVDGMPLAIVLAAAWVETLSVAEIAAELADGLDFLETDFHDIPERQRSIAAVFDYAWHRLNDDERDVFARIAVFRGGATRAALQAITGARLRVLQGLTNKGLLHREPNTGRYLVHELVRQYAELQLAERGAEAQIRTAHSLYYMKALAQSEADLKGRNQFTAVHSIEADFENIRAAWDWAAEQREYVLLQNAAESLELFCHFRSRRAEGGVLFQKAKVELAPYAGEEAHPAWWQIVAYYENYLAIVGIPSDESLSNIAAVLRYAREHNDKASIRGGLVARARRLLLNGETEAAVDPLIEAMAICQEQGDQFGIAWLDYFLSYCYLSLGQLEAARQHGQQGLALAQQIGNKILEAQVLNNLGAGAETSREAVQLVAQANVIYRAIDSRRGIAWTNINLAQFALARGDIEEAHQLVEQALVITADINEAQPHGFALCTLADVLRMKGNYTEALSLYAQSEPLLMGNPTAIPNVYIGWTYADCGLGDFQSARTHCYQALDLSAKIQIAALIESCLPAAALILFQQGEAQRAAEHLALTYHITEYSTGWMDKMSLLNELQRNLIDVLGVEGYAAAQVSGEALDVDAVVQELLEAFRPNE